MIHEHIEDETEQDEPWEHYGEGHIQVDVDHVGYPNTDSVVEIVALFLYECVDRLN